MKLSFAFLANCAELAPDGRFHVIGGGINGFSVAALPGVLPPMAVIANVHFPPDECGPEYLLRMRLVLPDGDVSDLESTQTLRTGVAHQAPYVGAHLKVVINVLNLNLPQYGQYMWNFFVGDRPIGELGFSVVRDQ